MIRHVPWLKRNEQQGANLPAASVGVISTLVAELPKAPGPLAYLFLWRLARRAAERHGPA